MKYWIISKREKFKEHSKKVSIKNEDFDSYSTVYLCTCTYIYFRCRRVFSQLNMSDFTKVNLEVLGSEHIYGPHSRVPKVCQFVSFDRTTDVSYEYGIER